MLCNSVTLILQLDRVILLRSILLKSMMSHVIKCVCGTSFGVDYTMVCRYGGLIFIYHNDFHGLMAAGGLPQCCSGIPLATTQWGDHCSCFCDLQ